VLTAQAVRWFLRDSRFAEVAVLAVLVAGNKTLVAAVMAAAAHGHTLRLQQVKAAQPQFA
jgi:hypothetical protein